MKKIDIDIDKIKTVQLFANEDFYENWEVFVRELLQNAMDACYTKRALELSWGTEFLDIEQSEQIRSIRESYDARITISYNSNTSIFSIEDNGIGMNEYDLENFVSKLGHSYYESEDFSNQRLDYEPMSKHGLGLCSCFMVARALLIESKKDNVVNTAWNIDRPQSTTAIVAKWFDYKSEIEFVESKRKGSGTKISLPLKSEYAKQINMKFMVWAVKHFTMYQPIPITIVCDDETVELYDEVIPWRFPASETLGSIIIEVNTEYLEGYIAIYSSKQKSLFGKSELFQQNFRVTEYVETLNLRPNWIENFTYQLNIKKRLLNINISKTTAAKDEKLIELRQYIGQVLIDYFGKNPYLLGAYISQGDSIKIDGYDAENELVSRAIMVCVFLKGREVEIPIRTVINGFMGRKIKIAFISKNLFLYLKKSYSKEFSDFIQKYDMIIFENNIKAFIQFLFQYIVSQEYIVGKIPGMIFTEIEADLSVQKKTVPIWEQGELRPKGCKNVAAFCLVSNELTSPFEIIYNPYNRNARLLKKAEKYKKVRKLCAIISENIKKRITTNNKSWNKIIDFGGEFVDEYTESKSLSLQSIWCLESDFPNEINELVIRTLTPQEISQYGLTSLFFTKADFIEWWMLP